jgi:membrane protein insertase Oxa1/YidC/SpoIIIJ
VTMLFAPAGLVIYWLVSNIWTIGQQYFTNWFIGPARTPAGAKVQKEVKESKGSKTAPPDIVVPPARGKK